MHLPVQKGCTNGLIFRANADQIKQAQAILKQRGFYSGEQTNKLNADTRALVNEETAARVLRAADELGYRPNPIARGLKTNRSYTVGVVIPDLTNPKRLVFVEQWASAEDLLCHFRLPASIAFARAVGALAAAPPEMKIYEAREMEWPRRKPEGNR